MALFRFRAGGNLLGSFCQVFRPPLSDHCLVVFVPAQWLHFGPRLCCCPVLLPAGDILFLLLVEAEVAPLATWRMALSDDTTPNPLA